LLNRLTIKWKIFFSHFQIFANNQIAKRMKINSAIRKGSGWFIAAQPPVMTAIVIESL
jgi:hypothetical protein